MPWCEDCAKYHAPSALSEAGACPSCGRVLEAPTVPPLVTGKNLDLKKLAAGADADAADEGAPWHFKLLMVLLVLYFIWRIVDLFL
ncbi:MAG: hypothetical protein JWN62_991 [Acidimicrobiales bacterium]|nr:hypothetical protein [Acidimicrobiales bacterium]